jgi:hypothetical protein
LNRQSVTVNTNDPENRQIKLTVKADIDLQIDSNPRRIWFGRINDLSPVTRSATIIGSRSDTLKIKSIRASDVVPPDVFSWKIRDQRSTNRGLTLDITIYPENAASGRFLHPLIIETDLVDVPEYVINLAGELEGTVYSNPARILFANYKPGQTLVETTLIKTHLQIPFVITSAESTDADIKVVVTDDEPALEHTLKILFSPSEDRPRLQTQLLISTDLEKQPALLLDVHGFQRREQRTLSLRD